MEKKKRMAIAGVRIVIVMITGVIALSLSLSLSAVAQPPLPPTVSPSENEPGETVPPIPTIPSDITPGPSPTVTPAGTPTSTPAATPTLTPTSESTPAPPPPATIPCLGISAVVIAVLSVFVLVELKGKKRRR